MASSRSFRTIMSMGESNTSCGRGAVWDDDLENMSVLNVEEVNIFGNKICDNYFSKLVYSLDIYVKWSKEYHRLAASRWQFLAGYLQPRSERLYFFGFHPIILMFGSGVNFFPLAC